MMLVYVFAHGSILLSVCTCSLNSPPAIAYVSLWSVRISCLIYVKTTYSLCQVFVYNFLFPDQRHTDPHLQFPAVFPWRVMCPCLNLLPSAVDQHSLNLSELSSFRLVQDLGNSEEMNVVFDCCFLLFCWELSESAVCTAKLSRTPSQSPSNGRNKQLNNMWTHLAIHVEYDTNRRLCPIVTWHGVCVHWTGYIQMYQLIIIRFSCV